MTQSARAGRRSARGGALTRRDILRLVPGVALGGVAAVLGASRSAQASPARRPIVAVASPAAATPVRGGVFKIPITAAVTPWPPIGLIQNLMVNKALFNSLVRYSPADWTPEPELAERWETSKDGLTWTFYLRKGVTWHDGHPFTADDVKYSLDMYADPKVDSILQGNLKPVSRVEVVNPTAIRVVTTNPYSSFIELLSYLTFMLPKHLLEGQEFNRTTFPQAFIRHPIGTGAFKFGEHVPGDHFTVVANENYYEGRPYLDSVIFKVVRDLNSTIVQVKTGELDVAWPTVAQLPALRGASNLHIVQQGIMDLRYFNINYRDPTFGKWYGERTVRQALAHAINTKGTIEQVAKGNADRSTGPIPPALKSWYVADAPVFDYDPERAKKMLAEAGFKAGSDGVLTKDGQRFAFTFNTDQGQPEREQTSLIIQQNLRDVGIDARLQTMEFNSFMQHQRVKFDYVAQCFYQVTPATPDLHIYWQTNGSANVWGYSNPTIDKLFQQGLATFDTAKRHAIYKQLYTLLAEDQAANFLYHPHELQAVNNHVRGWAQTDYRDALLYLNQVWIEK